MVKIKMNNRAIQKLGDQVAATATDAVNRGLRKHPGASRDQQVRDISAELKRAGIAPDESEIQNYLDQQSR